MKKLFLSFLVPVLAAAMFTACKPSVEKDGGDDTSIKAITKATRKKVESAVLGVPKDVSFFAYGYPTAGIIESYYQSDEEYFNTYARIAEIKGLSDAYDNFVKKINDEGKNDILQLRQGEFPSLMKSMANFSLKWGFVAYSEKIDFASPEKTNFAFLSFMDTSRIRKALSELEQKDEIQPDVIFEIKTKSDTFKAYKVEPDGPESFSFIVATAADKLVIANNADTVASFFERLSAPSKNNILENTEYKKLLSETKSPFMGLFADFKGFKLDMADMSTAMTYGMMNGMLGLDKMESAAIFYEDITNKDIFEGTILVSADEGAMLYDLFKGTLAARNALETAPQGSLYSMSFAIPERDSKIYGAITTIAAMQGMGEFLQSPYYKLVRENLKQINISFKQTPSSHEPIFTGALIFDDLDKALSTQGINETITLKNENGIEVFDSEMFEGEIFAIKTDAKTAVFSNDGDVATLSKLMKDKGGSMASLEGFQKLRKIADKNVAHEFYADYMAITKQFADLIDEEAPIGSEEATFMKALVKAFKDSMKDYKFSVTVKSDNKIIKLKSAYYLDFDKDKLVDGFNKTDWSYLNNMVDQMFTETAYLLQTDDEDAEDDDDEEEVEVMEVEVEEADAQE